MKFLYTLLILLLIFSCGKEADEKKQEEEVLKIDGSNIQGVYETSLEALNVNTTLGRVGVAGIHRSYDSFKAYVKFYIGDRGVIHKQSIHLGDRCPTVNDDINGDGYIDIREAYFVVGNIILPLDGDLDTQYGGSNNYPRGNAIAGGYFYERTASFSRLFEDLRDVDQNPLVDLGKLPYDQGLTFHNKVILILGIGNSIRLPESLDTLGMNKSSSFPVACGVLKRSGRFPAELYDRSDPVTSAERPSRVVIRPRTREHVEPDPEVLPPPPPADPPRRGGIRQRFRRWVRNTFGNGDDDGGGNPTE